MHFNTTISICECKRKNILYVAGVVTNCSLEAGQHALESTSIFVVSTEVLSRQRYRVIEEEGRKRTTTQVVNIV